jgi:uncharacterized membrane protein
MLKLTSEDEHFMRAVLTPSWLSGLVIALAGIVITGGAILTFSLNHSAFKQDLLGWEQSHTNSSLSVTGQSTQAVTPTLANSWSLILIWAAVGLITYIVAASIVRAIMETMEFRRELDYVHANPRSMLTNVIEHLVMRFIAGVLLVLLLILFVYHTLPYVISASRTSATNLVSVSGARYAAVAFLITALCTYAGSILLRLTLGRKRVF